MPYPRPPNLDKRTPPNHKNVYYLIYSFPMREILPGGSAAT
ncbi:hypothetical protein MITSMUL_04798 [Mitsuokella multacida DSM 20544]|uniref:Uncharacterized protein n=1 Tax=Mitsuokella multacida DSM 20544 TaxID=500635 RepID=C9KMY6_9FIRM|nr:hypothetical protein MITSMUL_04798 [Mitsuokella multacida DSM 20544]